MKIEKFASSPSHSIPYTIGSNVDAVLPFYSAVVDELPDGLDLIIATGDLQGVVRNDEHATGGAALGIELASTLVRLQREGALPQKDRTAILLTGDLQPSAGVEDVTGVWFALSAACSWIAGVAGNHDAFDGISEPIEAGLAMLCPNLFLLQEAIARIGSLVIGGRSGIASGDRVGDLACLERDFASAVGALVQERPDIMLMHDGPNVAGTELAGWPAVRAAIEAAPPTLVFRGHDSWPRRMATLNNGTQVVNVEGAVALLWERKVQWPDVATRAWRNTGGRVVPNPVVLDRNDRTF
jgi:hypothetical protein